MMLTSRENSKALTNLMKKLLEIFDDRRILASYFLLPLSKIIIPDYTSQFKLVNDAN